MEYWDSNGEKGVVYAFRGTIEHEKTHSFSLKGLQPSTRYRLHFHDHSSLDRTVTGRELMHSGMKVALSLPNGSELIFVERETP